MPEQADEQLPDTPRSDRGDRAEAVATLVALVWASAVAIVFAVYGGNVSLVGLLAIAPFIAAAFARPSRVALVGILTAFFALVISTPPHSYGELNHTLRVVTMLASTAVAMWISYLRGQRNVQLWTARSETRTERRRRVAAETAQRMQAMARHSRLRPTRPKWPTPSLPLCGTSCASTPPRSPCSTVGACCGPSGASAMTRTTPATGC